MTLPVPRVLLMCLALAFASVWLGCGPDLSEDERAPELGGGTLGDDEAALSCEELGEDAE